MGTRSIPQARRHALLLALIAGTVCAFAGWRDPVQFLHSYLFGYLVWFGIAAGCLALWLLGNIVGGAWIRAARPVLQAGALTFPALGIFFLPILLNLKKIYPWATALAPGEGLSLHQLSYLHFPFYAGRTVLYFLVWSSFALILHERASRRADPIYRSQALGAVGLFLFVMCITWASIDWIMSLEPHWSSSIYGVLVMIGDALSALAFLIITLDWRHRRGVPGSELPTNEIHDFGKLLLAFTILWTYMSLSQFLIIWSANLPEEIGWYIARKTGGWLPVGIVMVLFLFAAPFLLLLSRSRKQVFSRLVRVAYLIFGMRIVELFWLIAPDFSPQHFVVHVLDFSVPLALGGLWLTHFYTGLERVERQ